MNIISLFFIFFPELTPPAVHTSSSLNWNSGPKHESARTIFPCHETLFSLGLRWTSSAFFFIFFPELTPPAVHTSSSLNWNSGPKHESARTIFPCHETLFSRGPQMNIISLFFIFFPELTPPRGPHKLQSKLKQRAQAWECQNYFPVPWDTIFRFANYTSSKCR